GHWLLCRTATHHFAISLDCVIETMRALPIESVTAASRLVLGISIIRGEPVPVLDAAALFDTSSAGFKRFVTIRTGPRTIALAADEVLGISAIPANELQQLPPLLRDEGSLAAIAARDAELVFFLRSTRIISDEVLERIELARKAS